MLKLLVKRRSKQVNTYNWKKLELYEALKDVYCNFILLRAQSTLEHAATQSLQMAVQPLFKWVQWRRVPCLLDIWFYQCWTTLTVWMCLVMFSRCLFFYSLQSSTVILPSKTTKNKHVLSSKLHLSRCLTAVMSPQPFFSKRKLTSSCNYYSK